MERFRFHVQVCFYLPYPLAVSDFLATPTPQASAEPPPPNFRVNFFEGRVDGAKAPRKNGLSRGRSHGQSTARVKNLPWPEGLKEQSLDYVKHVIYLILYMRGVIS